MLSLFHFFANCSLPRLIQVYAVIKWALLPPSENAGLCASLKHSVFWQCFRHCLSYQCRYGGFGL